MSFFQIQLEVNVQWMNMKALLHRGLLFSAVKSDVLSTEKSGFYIVYIFDTASEITWNWLDNKNISSHFCHYQLAVLMQSAGFSVMNHILRSRRSRLTPDLLYGIMRIRLNGPRNIERFPSTRFARIWIKENHMRTDDPKQVEKLFSWECINLACASKLLL